MSGGEPRPSLADTLWAELLLLLRPRQQSRDRKKPLLTFLFVLLAPDDMSFSVLDRVPKIEYNVIGGGDFFNYNIGMCKYFSALFFCLHIRRINILIDKYKLSSNPMVVLKASWSIGASIYHYSMFTFATE